jgi:rhodanese-related sulfurtransferase
MNAMKFSLAAVLVLPSLVLAAHLPPAVGDMIRVARSEVKVIDMEGFKKVVDDPAGALILDVREESEYAAGHIPGATHLPRGLIEFGIWPLLGYPGEIDLQRPIYVQCVSGNRASLAAKTLKDLGFSNVTAVVMQLGEWRNAGYPFQ